MNVPARACATRPSGRAVRAQGPAGTVMPGHGAELFFFFFFRKNGFFVCTVLKYSSSLHRFIPPAACGLPENSFRDRGRSAGERIRTFEQFTDNCLIDNRMQSVAGFGIMPRTQNVTSFSNHGERSNRHSRSPVIRGRDSGRQPVVCPSGPLQAQREDARLQTGKATRL